MHALRRAINQVVIALTHMRLPAAACLAAVSPTAHHCVQSEGAEVVIALTHMRLPNDLQLAENVPGIDLVLGGVRPTGCGC